MKGDYKPEEIRSRWEESWESNNCFDHSSPADYTVDTPPPTVSGSLHLGHVYQYVIQDIPVRFARLSDKESFFPFGYDNNGIATERYIERRKNIDRTEVDTQEFQDYYDEVVEGKMNDYRDMMRKLGVSVEWDKEYQTISDNVKKKSQLSFIELYSEGREYREETPSIWCPKCQTAISQAETETLSKPSSYQNIRFDLTNSDDYINIETTRPELLPACVSIFINPDDDRSKILEGKEVQVPLFDHTVQIRTDKRVDMEEGSGIVMCCTFGDTTDIEWYKSHNLELRVAVDNQGEMTQIADEFSGLSVSEAREQIVHELDERGYIQDSRDIDHEVQTHDRCETPTEYRTTNQWYIKVLDKKDEYLDIADEINWYPEKMRERYEQWVEGLEWDWCISRQRDVGIPIPCWYCKDCQEPIVAEKEQLPIDPVESRPPVNRCSNCGCQDFNAEHDVFDTWATSSITPLINSGWKGLGEFEYPDRYPMSVRPQGHDIISTWLFYTIVKCYEHTDEIPFEDVLINGHILDENMEKMSASRGNVVDPQDVIDQYPIDSIRYWCSGSSVGSDIPYKEQNLESAERVLRKIWNASKLVDQILPNSREPIAKPDDIDKVDEWLLDKLSGLSHDVSGHYREYEYEKARRKLRTFFWHTFCDDYLEIAKQRENNQSLRYTIQKCHKSILKMFYPIIPFTTEEVWDEMYSSSDIIKNSSWSSINVNIDPEVSKNGDRAMNVISSVRSWKSSNGFALNQNISKITIFGSLGGFDSILKSVTHSDNIESVDPDEMELSISINYEVAGPKYGEDIQRIESEIENGQFELTENGKLDLEDYTLECKEFHYDRVPSSVEGENVINDEIPIRIRP